MEPVARESGVSTATLYGFFESKTALFEAVLNAATEEISERLEALPTETGSVQDRLNALLAFYAEFLSNEDVQAVFRLVLAERHRFVDVSSRFFERGRNRFGASLIALIKKLDKSGDLKVKNSTVAAGQLMGMIEHSIFFLPLIDDEEADTNRSPQQIAEDAVETFLARYKA
ncbi:TetR/AcrR family transcriptional regulator C-terminal domain-containing protein [Brevundimonas vesicularis]|uniref:TetR/AcrR family transcriptional regulator n=1 Tax=Brevundimonas vesicularis TaxID=41276 RepID=UPI0038D4A7F9